MGTFIGQLIGFAVIVLIIMKYVVPPVRKAMIERQTVVRTQLEDSAKAAQRLADADQYRSVKLDEGRIEARHIIDEAASDSVRIGEQLRIQGGVEAERIKVQGDQQVLLLRSQLIRELRGELGTEALRRAEEIVRAHVADPRELSATVDRFLDEMEAMAPVVIAPAVSPTDLRPASRDAQAAVVAKFDELSAPLSTDDLTKLSAELAAIYTLLIRESTLARYLADTGGVIDAKKLMLEQLLAGKVGSDTLAILSTAVSARWSTNKDFVHCVEHISRLSLLERAEREQQAEEVAEQIFRFGRVLEAQPRLTSLLSDYHEPAAGRVTLLCSILDASQGANATTIALLAQSIELLHGERFDEVVADLSQLAVARRGEIVAEVGAAADLSEAQRQRLNQVLTRIYHHPVSVQLNIGPRLLGGLSVAVGDEVIDGTLSSRLAVAALKLPS